MKALSIGDPAPDFVVDASTGNTFHNMIMERKAAAVVYFYPMDFSPVCSAQACMIRGIYNSTIADSSPLIIGVSPQSDRVHSKFRDSKKLPQILVADQSKEIAASYGAVGLFGVIRRVSYVINSDKRITGRAFGSLSLTEHKGLLSEFVESLTSQPDV